jgi:hypothetical protein
MVEKTQEDLWKISVCDWGTSSFRLMLVEKLLPGSFVEKIQITELQKFLNCGSKSGNQRMYAFFLS